MGIFCDISMFQPPNIVYQPGQNVSGVIKYAIDEPIEVERIITSLKGVAAIVITDNPGGGKHETTYASKYEIVDVDTIIQEEQVTIPFGSYEVKFNYILPEVIPSSLKFRNYFDGYKIKCSIQYYVRIKFEKPGFLSFDKHFRKEIHVISAVTSKLSREPVIYGDCKRLINLFSSKESIVNIKATIPDSVCAFNGKINVCYEVTNNSHVLVKSVTAKLVEAFVFKAKGHPKVAYDHDVPGTETMTAPINSGDSQTVSIDTIAPSYVYNIDNSWIVCRHYFIRIVVQLPFPHRNLVLNIPVQIGVIDEHVNENISDVNYDDAPPSYWEAMGDGKEKYTNDSDNELD